MELIKPGRQFDFMGKRSIFFAISAVFIVLSLFAFLVWPKPKLGTDFQGGTEIEVVFKKPVEAGQIREAVSAAGFATPDIVGLTDSGFENHFMIRVQEVSEISPTAQQEIKTALCYPPEGEEPPADRCPPELRPLEVKFSPGGDRIFLRYDPTAQKVQASPERGDEVSPTDLPIKGELLPHPDLKQVAALFSGVGSVQLRGGDQSVVFKNDRVEVLLKSKGQELLDGLTSSLGADVVPESPIRVEWIGAKATTDLRNDAIKSIVIAVFFIMAYIAFRFDMRFAPGAVLALVHDVFIAMGAMVLTNRDISLSTVAAMLTIVGYSINDTVVIFDRIRENLGRYRGKTFNQIINLSVSETLSRTIITSGLTVLSLGSFLFFGTGVLKDFAFALMVGVIVGTYSSIYIASPVTEWVDRRFFGGRTAKGKRRVDRTRRTKRAETVV